MEKLLNLTSLMNNYTATIPFENQFGMGRMTGDVDFIFFLQGAAERAEFHGEIIILPLIILPKKISS